ncbi:MAG: hypothetical protein LBQ09_05460, partial [Acidobacteriaceae bacterium]|nr:hypothetical protein [Acidobacteriaceae bacterium]
MDADAFLQWTCAQRNVMHLFVDRFLTTDDVAAIDRATGGAVPLIVPISGGVSAHEASQDHSALGEWRERLRKVSRLFAVGSHANHERQLRQTIAALARRRDWESAALGITDLARGLLRRGRAAEA